MFSEASVSHSVNRGRGFPTPPLSPPDRDPLELTSSGGYCSDRMHPTGMHSCFFGVFVRMNVIVTFFEEDEKTVLS